MSSSNDLAPWEPNLTWIVPGLAVGGSVPAERAPDLAVGHRVRAVVDLRTERCDNAALLRRLGVTFLHLPTPDHCAVTRNNLGEGVLFANRHLDRAEPVLIHCEHGIGRSATLALCVLVSRGFSPLAALEIAKARRPLVSPSPAQYEAWIEWLASWRRQSGAGWPIPSFDSFKAIAYRHLSEMA